MKDAEYYEVQVEEGDIVVMCSDGLSDNLVRSARLGALVPADSPLV
jgi:serine/threonine protein phosphatase PrpC